MLNRLLLAGALSVLVAGIGVAGDETEKKPDVTNVKEKTAKEAKEKIVVLMETTMGDIKLELDAKKAPKTVENFMVYAREGFYDGTIFHRVIEGFMIQGGGFTADLGRKEVHPPIPLESKNGLKNLRGTIAMARTSQPNSATSQFFINHKDNASLDYPSPDGNGYAVFGKVIDGLDVVDKIAAVETTVQGPHKNVPAEPIVIKSVKEID
jgi:peptidyl-prolyl cis-trans isomerase A (cyclophilin A)